MSELKSWIQEDSKGGVLLRLKIQPQASKAEIIGLHGDPPRLKVRVAAPPVDGKANDELVRFLKKLFGIPTSQIEIIRGQTAPLKDILCRGLSLDEAIIKIDI